MTIEGAASSALNGLNAFSTAVSSISENLANVSTVAFKRVDTQFRDLIGGYKSVYTHPETVRATPIYRNDLAGQIQNVDNPTSFAIASGDGFVTVSPLSDQSGVTTVGTDQYYTRAADFSIDANGYLSNPAGNVLLGIKESSQFSGTFPAAAALSGLAPVQVTEAYRTLPGVQSSTINVNANFPAGAAIAADPASGGVLAGASASDQTLSVPFFNSLGTERTLNLTFRKTGTNQWSAIDGTIADVPAVSVIPAGGPYPSLSFSDTGRLTASGQMTFSAPSGFANGGTLSGLLVDFGAPNLDSTQWAGSGVELRDVRDVNGHGPGEYKSAAIDKSGNVIFNYTNGLSKPVYRVPLATFTDPDKLDRLTGATFGANPKVAGDAAAHWAGEANAGEIVPSSREQSNVDIGTELVKMISAQRAYSSNAKVLSTTDQMTEVATQLKT